MFKFKGSPMKCIVVLAVWEDDSCTTHVCRNSEEEVRSALDSVSNPLFVKRCYIGSISDLLDGDYLDSSYMEEYIYFSEQKTIGESAHE